MFNYEIAFTQYFGDINYSNTLCTRVDARKDYFKYDDLFKNAFKVNFDTGTVQRTNVVITMPVDNPFNDSYNYAIVRKAGSTVYLNYMHYFIESREYLGSDKVRFFLKLDVFNTYFYKFVTDHKELTGYIERCLYDRFDVGYARLGCYRKDDVRNKVSPDEITQKEVSNNIEFSLIGEDHINAATDAILTNTKSLLVRFKAWVYVYMKSGTIKGKGPDGSAFETPDTGRFGYSGGEFDEPYFILCAPLTEYGGGVVLKTQDQKNIDATKLEDILNMNGGTSRVISIKLSCRSPFPYSLKDRITPTKYLLGANGTTLILPQADNISGSTGATKGNSNFAVLYTSDKTGAVLLLRYDENKEQTYIYSRNTGYGDIAFSRNEVVSRGPTKFPITCPPTMKPPYRSFNIELYGESMAMDITAFLSEPNEQPIKLTYREALTPDISRIFISPNQTMGSSPYNSDMGDLYHGLSIAADTSLTFSTDQLDAYMSQNKNFFMQRGVAQLSSLGGSLLSGNYASGAINGLASVADTAMTVDNLFEAPDRVSNLNGNILLNLMFMVDGRKLYPRIKYYRALEGQLKAATARYEANGYPANFYGTLYEYSNNRSVYSYIKGDFPIVSGNLMHFAAEEMRGALLRGVRFWDTTSYSENQLTLNLNNGERVLPT